MCVKIKCLNLVLLNNTFSNVIVVYLYKITNNATN